MRKGLAVGCWVVATALGIGVGHYALPERSTVHWPWVSGSPSKDATSASTADASAPPEQLPTNYARTPPTKHDLASVKNFTDAGMDVTVYYRGKSSDQNTAATFCSEQAGPGARTLGDLTGYDPSLGGNWSDKHSDGNTVQMIAVADSPQAAKVAAQELLNSNTPCRHQKIGHDVLGKPQQQLIAPGVWAAWIGRYPGDQNTTGEAPPGEEPCGGELIIRNGQRFSTLDLYMCADTEQLRTLAIAAAKRLG